MNRQAVILNYAARPVGRLMPRPNEPIQEFEQDILCDLIIQTANNSGVAREDIGSLLLTSPTPATQQLGFATFLASRLGLRCQARVSETNNMGITGGLAFDQACEDVSSGKTDFAVACAETGGVIGVNGIGIFLGDNEATVTNMVKHTDYLVQLVGPDHVGIGLDYVFDRQEVDDFVKKNPQIFPPEDGYSDGLTMLAPAAIPELIQGLVELGYDDDVLCKIMGGNHLRVARQVWK